jgi:excisionase family DNA binding protein
MSYCHINSKIGEEMQTETLITVGELAKRLSVPVSWIYSRTRLGQRSIPHIKLGKYVRFNLDEVVTYFKDCRQQDIP